MEDGTGVSMQVPIETHARSGLELSPLPVAQHSCVAVQAPTIGSLAQQPLDQGFTVPAGRSRQDAHPSHPYSLPIPRLKQQAWLGLVHCWPSNKTVSFLHCSSVMPVKLGVIEGSYDGDELGACEGSKLGTNDGWELGADEGWELGITEGFDDG